ncbi:MAG: hypothetical protein CFH40_00561 [Alphaproteobacteria bacterium MarineAlpha10_Bin3]|jgi:hypothetical protein|nr:MAG: hypothetical protein CFH40_00561 [Alphaproteobacteria bacterium MarineAlpha10_Bin3]PPR74571.1 MAG: hypothetical protein CFH09_00561 [Alphaproteobacteria bacterium MarineAlpha4_Bin1]
MEKLHALPEDIILDWWGRKWLGPIYAHSISLGNFDGLYIRASGARAIPE